MTTVAKTSLIVSCIGIILIISVAILIFWLERQPVGVGRIEYYKLYFEAIKTVLIGFVVALLVVLIPQGIAESRHRFEKLKESRIAYSEAKTGADYLPLRLSTLSLKEAAALVQQVHFWKHQAELYEELEQHLKRRGFEGTPEQWGDMIYDKLFSIRTLLEEHAQDWDDLRPNHRLTRLLKVQPSVKETRNDG